MGYAARNQKTFERCEERAACVPAPAVRPLEVALVSPAQYEDVHQIARLCGGGRLVLVNLEDVPRDAARRIIDFISGVAYAQDGRFERLSRGSYAVVPADAELLDRRTDEPDEWDRYF